MDDTISRQTVLDAIDEISREVDDGDGFDYVKWREYFCELPSIQFATDTNVGTKLGTNLAQLGTDCISRQAAIEMCREPRMRNADCSDFEMEIMMLPSIQPKRGKWVLVCDNNGMHFICNKCGAWRYHQEQKFCGECGADMRGEHDGRLNQQTGGD